MEEAETTSLNQLISNPSGIGSSFLSSRKAIKEDLYRKFVAVVEKNKKTPFRMASFEDKKEEKIYFHIQVLSESLEKPFFFDVVLEFNTIEWTKKALMESEVKIFSNSPSFVFSYAFVAKENDLIIPWMEKLIEKKALTENPRVRNPVEIMGFEKSIYFAYLWMEENEFFKRSYSSPTTFSKKKILDIVESSEKILSLYNNQKKKEAAERKKEKEKKKLALKKAEANKLAAKKANKASKSKTISKAKTTKKVSKVKSAIRKRN
jgi:hypothetical protein